MSWSEAEGDYLELFAATMIVDFHGGGAATRMAMEAVGTIEPIDLPEDDDGDPKRAV